MSDISIDIVSTELVIEELINKIQTEIIDKAETSGGTLKNIIEHSSGDFINSINEEMIQEVEVINSIGELLKSIAEYIQSAAEEFAKVDSVYSTSRISE